MLLAEEVRIQEDEPKYGEARTCAHPLFSILKSSAIIIQQVLVLVAEERTERCNRRKKDFGYNYLHSYVTVMCLVLYV